MAEIQNLEIKKEPLKNLATCKPTEFVKQTVRIKKSAEKWLKATDIMNIMQKKPEKLEKLTDDMSADERQAAFERNKEIADKLAKEKISKAFDAMLEQNPAETLEILALSCFVEPEDVDTHTIDEYFSAWNAMLNNSSVLSFFISFIRLANKPI